MKAKKTYNKGGKIDPPKGKKMSKAELNKDAAMAKNRLEELEGEKKYMAKRKEADRAYKQAIKEGASESQANKIAEKYLSYKNGGILPPAVRALKKKAAKKKAKEAPVKGGMLAETTVTAKAPTASERIKREVNKPVGSDFTFIGDPSGKIGQVGKVAKVAKSLLKSKGYKAMAKIAAKKGKAGTASVREAQSRANTFDALEGMRAVKEGRISNKVFNKLADKVRKGGVNPRTPYLGAKPLSDKEIAKRMAGAAKKGNAKGAAYKQSLKDFKAK